ncbi:MAG: hypothetical protein H7196_03550 [candidate division SR1 bacterium]|nr:hypothetical protein [candidate division SR1 bacterium]
MSIKKVKFGEYFLLLLEIQKSIINYNCYKNDCYQRIGASNKKLTIEEYHQKRLSQNIADWSGQICENATLDDLDLNTIELLKKDIQQYKPSSWDSKYSNKLNAELLTRLGLVINNKITNACILMFGQSEKFENDKRFTGFARIQWQYYPDKDVTKYGKTREQFFIPFYPAIKEIWQKIDSKNDTLANQSLYQSEEKQYEEITIRELLLNSIAHREYANFGMRPFIEIIQTREGITFKNSGKPPFDSIYELEEKKQNITEIEHWLIS